MKIGIDARMYGPKVGGGGLGRYVEQLVAKLQEIDQENRYVLFLKKENFDLCAITNPNFEKRLADVHWYTFDEQRILPKIIDAEKLDLIHFPHWNVPLLLRTPFVVTIHDLILLDDPSSAKATTLGPIKYAIKKLGHRAALKNAVTRSKKIIAVSKATELSILKHFPSIEPNKIAVIYEGVISLPPPNHGLSSEARAKEGGGGMGVGVQHDGNTLLYIGNSYPHKNLKTLLDAFKIFSEKQPDAKLVMAGHKDLFSEAIEKYAREKEITKVEFFRDIDDSKLAELYASAKLYVFPSRLEGFGLPALEAMSMSVPVIAARAGSLPEILGEAAEYFDPNDTAKLVSLMEKLWLDETRRSELIALGLEQIKKYSWRVMAERIKNIYTVSFRTPRDRVLHSLPQATCPP